MKNQIEIFFIGDSYVNGFGDSRKLGWAGRVSLEIERKGFEITHYNLGIKGDTSRDILNRWEQEVAIRNRVELETLFIFSFGTNDINMEMDIEESISNSHKILEKAHKMGRLLFVGPPPIIDKEFNKKLEKLDDAFHKLGNRLGIPYLSLYKELSKKKDWFEKMDRVDDFHPSDIGHQVIANLILEWLIG
jgi:lysophospholipase L1-like esterase